MGSYKVIVVLNYFAHFPHVNEGNFCISTCDWAKEINLEAYFTLRDLWVRFQVFSRCLRLGYVAVSIVGFSIVAMSGHGHLTQRTATTHLADIVGCPSGPSPSVTSRLPSLWFNQSCKDPAGKDVLRASAKVSFKSGSSPRVGVVEMTCEQPLRKQFGRSEMKAFWIHFEMFGMTLIAKQRPQNKA